MADIITNDDAKFESLPRNTFLAKCLWLKCANSCPKTEASCASLSAFKNRPPFTPIIPPGAAKAFNDLSSIRTIENSLSST